MTEMKLLPMMIVLVSACSTVTTADSFDATRGAVVITRSDEGSPRAIDDELTEILVLELDLIALAETSLPIDLTLDGTASFDAETETWSFEAEPGHSALVPSVSYDRACFCSWIGTNRSTTVRGQLRISSLSEDHVKGRVTSEGEFDGGSGLVEWSMSGRFDVDR